LSLLDEVDLGCAGRFGGARPPSLGPEASDLVLELDGLLCDDG
jgi:hypothetical protein